MQALWGRDWRRRVAILGVFALLGGCAEEADLSARPSAVQPLPADPAVAQLYVGSCQQCHANPAAGAPLSGDAAAWAPRLAKGLDSLLSNTINGFQGMPPMGQCMHCGQDELLALIEFMAASPSSMEDH